MRKRKPKKRILLPDPKFNDTLVTRFVNDLMISGKKNISYNIFYSALDIVKEKSPNAEKTPLDIWKKSLAFFMRNNNFNPPNQHNITLVIN